MTVGSSGGIADEAEIDIVEATLKEDCPAVSCNWCSSICPIDGALLASARRGSAVA